MDGDTYRVIGQAIERNADKFWALIHEEGRTVESCIILVHLDMSPHGDGTAFDFEFNLVFREEIPDALRDDIGEGNLAPAKPGQLRVVVFGPDFRAGINLYPAMLGASRGGQA